MPSTLHPFALTRAVSPAINRCELSHLPRAPIDLGRARAQHRGYEQLLEECGCRLLHLLPDPELPDSVFVEDTALVLEELAVITRPGAASRRAETLPVAAVLERHRPLAVITSPATLDGGDLLVLGKQIFLGLSTRSSPDALNQLQDHTARYGYSVRAVPITGCLHLKSAVTLVGWEAPGAPLLLLNPEWVDPQIFAPWSWIGVDPAEPQSANALLIGDNVIYPDQYPRTAARLKAAGVQLRQVDVSELVKAEGAVTCCSLVFNPG